MQFHWKVIVLGGLSKCVIVVLVLLVFPGVCCGVLSVPKCQIQIAYLMGVAKKPSPARLDFDFTAAVFVCPARLSRAQRLSMRLIMGFHGFSCFWRRSALPIGHKKWFAKVPSPARRDLDPTAAGDGRSARLSEAQHHAT